MYLDYAGIRVTDLGRSLVVYSHALGLRELRRGTMGHGGVWVLLEDPKSRQRLELNWYPKGSRYDTPFHPGDGLDHVGVRVRDTGTLTQQLVAVGCSVVEKSTEGGVDETVYLTDPDGNWIELILDPND